MDTILLLVDWTWNTLHWPYLGLPPWVPLEAPRLFKLFLYIHYCNLVCLVIGLIQIKPFFFQRYPIKKGSL